MLEKIVVVVSGGVVRNVFTDNPEVEVEVLDFDNAECSTEQGMNLTERLAECESELNVVY